MRVLLALRLLQLVLVGRWLRRWGLLLAVGGVVVRRRLQFARDLPDRGVERVSGILGHEVSVRVVGRVAILVGLVDALER